MASDPVLAVLRNRLPEACFSTEVAASLGADVEQVEEILRELQGGGAVYLEEFSPPDPHFPRLLVASSVDPVLPTPEAQEAARRRVQQAYQRWLREVLATHRCIG